MSAHATRRSAIPTVDEGDALGLATFLSRELRPTPGRLADSVRVVTVVLIVVGIAETFRLPDIALSAYIVLFLSKSEAVSTVLSALISGIAALVAIVSTIAVFMLSLSEPALRVPLMAIATFGAAFLARTATLGPVFFTGGFIIAYGLTFGDELLGLALQPATAGNASQSGVPEFAFVSPEEALVQTLLWLSLAATMPLAALILANLLTGRDPARVLRDALAKRLATAARFCASEKGAEIELEAQAFEGAAWLRKLHHLAGLMTQARRVPIANVSLIDEVGRLGLLLLAWSRVEGNTRDALSPAVVFCREAERAVRTGEAPRAQRAAIAATGAARPLADAISRTLLVIAGTSAAPLSGAAATKSGDAAQSPRRLLAADAFSNPEYARFALKLTMAVMSCYFIENLANWPGIGTSVVTCFMVGLGSVGETLHKATLRIVGALIGAGLGLGAILLFMPQMTSLGDLFLLLAPVTLLAAWIACGSERIAYAGVQIGLAFYLVVLHGTGPTVDLYTARDRVIGILLGNVVMFVIFTTIWPVSVASIVRVNLTKAFGQLATLVGLGDGENKAISQVDRTAANLAFVQALAQTRALLVNDPFETSEVRRIAANRPIDANIVTQVGRLFIPVAMILDLITLPAERDLPQLTRDTISAYHRTLAAWFRRAASWVRNGEGGAELAARLPEPPILSGPGDYLTAFVTWYQVLDQDIRKIFDQIGPQSELAVTSPARDALHAAS
jgi:multidrug resistance protein MdtO